MAFLKTFSGPQLPENWGDRWEPVAREGGALFSAALSNGDNEAKRVQPGDKIYVPEGYGAVLFEGAECTGFITEEGGYLFSTDEEHRQLVYAGILSASLKTSWDEYHKEPEGEQALYYFALHELGAQTFHTDTPVTWNDVSVAASLTASIEGTYGLKIVDAILLFHNAVSLYSTDFNVEETESIFLKWARSQVLNALPVALSQYASDLNSGDVEPDAKGIVFGNYISQARESFIERQDLNGVRVMRLRMKQIRFDDASKRALAVANAARAERKENDRREQIAKVEARFQEKRVTSASIYGPESFEVDEQEAAVFFAREDDVITDEELIEAVSEPSTVDYDRLEEQLVRLRDLHEKGLIDEDELKAMKKNLLHI